MAAQPHCESFVRCDVILGTVPDSGRAVVHMRATECACTRGVGRLWATAPLALTYFKPNTAGERVAGGAPFLVATIPRGAGASLRAWQIPLGFVLSCRLTSSPGGSRGGGLPWATGARRSSGASLRARQIPLGFVFWCRHNSLNRGSENPARVRFVVPAH